MKICVVTTTRNPASNLGDQLIADRCADMVRAIDQKAVITSVFQGAEWDDAKKHLTSADAVVFACLAIRKEIFQKNYKFVDHLLATKTPICVVSAGISIGAFSDTAPLTEILSSQARDKLKELASRSLFFSSRGYLTQAALSGVGIPSVFAGDVAFFDPRFRDRLFSPPEQISRIAISDPHYAPIYRNSFLHLVKQLRLLFPYAQTDLLVHGHNDEMLPIAEEAGINIVKLYECGGLDAYDSYDLHVGYRVHGHVSALTRRKPSYLLEQDDRGTDYGTKFSRRISVASHRNIARKDPETSVSQVLTWPVDTLVSTLQQDVANGFARFVGLEPELDACGTRNLEGVKEAFKTANLMDGPHRDASFIPRVFRGWN